MFHLRDLAHVGSYKAARVRETWGPTDPSKKNCTVTEPHKIFGWIRACS